MKGKTRVFNMQKQFVESEVYKDYAYVVVIK